MYTKLWLLLSDVLTGPRPGDVVPSQPRGANSLRARRASGERRR